MIEDAIILAGGFGTRLRPLTLDIPKPLLPIGNVPFLESQFFRLKESGVKRVVLSVFHQADAIKRALKTLKTFGIKVTLVKEPKPLGTAGAIAYAWPDKDKPCLVLNGDILSDVQIGPMAAQHIQSQAGATIWSIDVAETSAFGVIETKPDGQITRFVEKPRPGESSSQWINAGLYVLSPEVLRLIPRRRQVSIERETFPQLLKSGVKTCIYKAKTRPYWNDIGTPKAYLRVNLDILERRLTIGTLWKGLRGDAVIAKGCHLAKGAVVKQSVLLEGCRIGKGAMIEGAILGRNCIIEADTRIHEGAILGRGTHLTEGSHA